MRQLLIDNHEPRKRQLQHIREALGISRSLLQAGVVERLDEPEPDGPARTASPSTCSRTSRSTSRCRRSRSPRSTCSTRSRTTYALDVVSVIEATLDDPRQILSRAAVQGPRRGGRGDEGRGHRVRRADGAARGGHLPQAARRAARRRVRALPAEPPVGGRLAAVPQVGRARHVRAGDDLRRVRRVYELARSEGLVLRYLSDAYRALRPAVPAAAHTEELSDLIEWLGELVRQVDSSLLDEWEQLDQPRPAARRARGGAGPPAAR